MFWWIHGIFTGITAIFWGTSVLSYLIEKQKLQKNPVLNLILNAEYYITEISLAVFPIIELGLFLSYKHLKEEASHTDEESIIKWTESHPNQNMDIYRESMHDSYMAGWWIALGMILFFIIAAIIAGIAVHKNNSTQRELEKVKQAYRKASDSNVPEIRAMAPVFKKTIKKIELQEEMKAMSIALKSIKKLQNSRDYVDVQKELDELNAMYELDGLEAKYKSVK